MSPERGPHVTAKRRYWHLLVIGAGILVPTATLIVPNVIKAQYSTGCNRTRAEICTIMQSLSEYAINHDGRYPDTLQPLVTPNAEGHCFLEGFDGHIPRDPWQREYRYEPPTLEHPFPRVLSLGKDGELGGEGDDADIDSDHLKDE